MKCKSLLRMGAWSVVLTLAVAGCGKKESAGRAADPPPLEKVKEGARDAVASTKEFFVEQKERWQKNFSAKLAEFDKQLEELKDRSSAASDKTKSELARAVEILQKKKAAAARKLEQLKSSSADAWRDVKAGAEKAFAEAEQAFKEALGRFKNEGQSAPK